MTYVHKCNNCPKDHDNFTSSCDIPEAPWYVVSVDPFFSNDEYANAPVVPCRDLGHANDVARYVRSRGDQKNIRMFTRGEFVNLPQLDPTWEGTPMVFNLLSAWAEHRVPEVPHTATQLVFNYYDGLVTVEAEGTFKGKASGWGYDKKGAALGDWLTQNWKPLRKLHLRAMAKYDVVGENYTQFDRVDDAWKGEQAGLLYGLYAYYTPLKNGKRRMKRVSVDGACGFESVEKIIKAAGWSLVKINSDDGDATPWDVYALFKGEPRDEKG